MPSPRFSHNTRQRGFSLLKPALLPHNAPIFSFRFMSSVIIKSNIWVEKDMRKLYWCGGDRSGVAQQCRARCRQVEDKTFNTAANMLAYTEFRTLRRASWPKPWGLDLDMLDANRADELTLFDFAAGIESYECSKRPRTPNYRSGMGLRPGERAAGLLQPVAAPALADLGNGCWPCGRSRRHP